MFMFLEKCMFVTCFLIYTLSISAMDLLQCCCKITCSSVKLSHFFQVTDFVFQTWHLRVISSFSFYFILFTSSFNVQMFCLDVLISIRTQPNKKHLWKPSCNYCYYLCASVLILCVQWNTTLQWNEPLWGKILLIPGEWTISTTQSL